MAEENYSNISTGIGDVIETVMLDNFIVSCAPLTIILNAFVLLIALKYVNFKVRLEQLYVVNMTVSDLMFGLVFMTTAKYSMNLPWWYCRPFYVLLWTSSIGSVMFLLLLNVHKLVTLFFPFYSMIFMSKKRVLIQIGICWAAILIVTTVYSIEPLLEVRSDAGVSCAVVSHPIFYACKVMVMYVLPLVMSLMISTAIFVLVQKKARKTTNVEKERRKLWKRILFVFTSTFWTGVTCVPYRVTTMKVQLCRSLYNDFWAYGSEENPDVPYNDTMNFNETLVDSNLNTEFPQVDCISDVKELLHIFQMLMIIGTVVNPFITVGTQTRYRKGVKDLWDSLMSFLHCRLGYIPANTVSTLKDSPKETLPYHL